MDIGMVCLYVCNQSINQYSFITGMPERRPSNRIYMQIHKYNRIVFPDQSNDDTVPE